MFRKEGMKKMALSCMLAFPLLFGTLSIGYCGGGAGAPTGNDQKISGTPLDGFVLITGDGNETERIGGILREDILSIRFIGHCGGIDIDIEDNAIGAISSLWLPEDSSELKNAVLPNGQGLTNFECSPQGGETENDLIVHTVKNFWKIGSVVLAEVTIKWIVDK